MTSSKSQDLFLTKFFDIYNDVDPEDDEDDQQQERIWNFTKPENVKRLLLYFVCSNDGDSVLKILHTFEVMQPMGMYLLSPAAIIMGRKRDPMSLEFKDMLMKIYGKRVFEMHQDTLDIETLVQTCCETSPCMCEPYESSELKHVSQWFIEMDKVFAKNQFVKAAVEACCKGSSRNARTDKFILEQLFPEASYVKQKTLLKRKRATEASLREEMRDSKKKFEFHKKKYERITSVLLPSICDQIKELEHACYVAEGEQAVDSDE